MTSRYKTQCPRCHTIYPMPESKLGEEKARANCGKCHHTFFLNSHIIKADEATKVDPKPNQTNAKPPQKTVAQTTATPKAVAQSASPNPPQTTAPKTAKSQQATATPAKEMIFDDMDGDDKSTDTEVNFSADGLDDFLKQDFNSNTPMQAATAKDSAHSDNADEAWLDELLKNDDSPNIAVTKVAHVPNDDISDILGGDINNLIPVAPQQESSTSIQQKINERLQPNTPTQEQIATKRSLGSQLFWALGSLVMVGLMGGQYVFFNQEKIATNPDKSALVRSLCPICILPSADTNAFETTYELSSGQADFTTNMITTIKNTSGNEQVYPNLKIRVMGQSGLIGDLALSPKEYLTVEQDRIASNQMGRFMLTLDVATEDIASISIEPFY